jgi:hypothetical protein
MSARYAACSCEQLNLTATSGFSDSGEARTFRFCPECGGTVFFTTESAPELIAVPVGMFADPEFPAPKVSVWKERRHRWLDLPGVRGESRHRHDD